MLVSLRPSLGKGRSLDGLATEFFDPLICTFLERQFSTQSLTPFAASEFRPRGGRKVNSQFILRGLDRNHEERLTDTEHNLFLFCFFFEQVQRIRNLGYCG